MKQPFPGIARRTGGAVLAVVLAVSGIYAVTFASGTALAQKTSASSAPIGPAWLSRSVSIELKDKEVGEALTELARQSGHKILVSPEAAQRLKQKVTMHFIDLQFGACLDLIVKISGLVYSLSGGEPGGVITVDVPR